ncbi:hypothetical protein GCM10025857_14580 [Alicyclobacillus contaminans]|uniref:hypothetical protein n=1 Tax=Alicyclobacillus contaminans TaxID=392016 RepID=UPI0003FDA304|nr:hypothetical protein [Alicyclobacillus contaminans]GMA50101.1 hypothetical protein GCM10025857_14580 [Alicyclobacillus contaminans]
MTRTESLHAAQQHMQAAYQALRDGGFDGAAALEHLQAFVMDVWSHANGLVAYLLGGMV